MEMRASEDVSIGQDLTHPLPPLAFSLHDSSLLSHCSACFSLLSPPPHRFAPLLPISPQTNSHPAPSPSVLYCSPQCSEADSDLHLSSAEHHLLLRSDLALCGVGDTTDLRAALRLLRRFEQLNLISRQTSQFDRIGGLMSNRDEFMYEEHDVGVLTRIKDGAQAMAMARRMRDGLVFEFSGRGECVLEEAVLCVVLTNAVEVQVSGGPSVGIAVYDPTFSWINHSCSPNACYYFPLTEYGAESSLRIVRAVTGRGCSSDEIEVIENVDCNNSETAKVLMEYGPRIVVRSIKAIKKFEEVSVCYIDLLQPKVTRHSELWLKYRFICFCQRCSVSPPTYVDHTLQEISAVNCRCANMRSDHHLCIDEEATRFSDNVDDAIADYLKFGNPKSSCEKLENLLTHCLIDEKFETKEENRKQQFWLHPLHHLSLSAYTALASAYKIRASDLLSLDPEVEKLQLEAFNMSRTSAGYSLLLAGATHHLFLFESSLVASVAHFWIFAGESLLNVARSPVWKLFAKGGLTSAEISSCSSYKCCICTLVDNLETHLDFIHARDEIYKDLSTEFLNCITRVTPKVWTFLINQSSFLKLISDPIDFKWIGHMKSFRTLDFESNLAHADAENTVSTGESWICGNQENISLFQLGVHCLLYGSILLSICFGKHSHLDDYMQNLYDG